MCNLYLFIACNLYLFIAMMCPNLENPLNGGVTFSDGTSFGSVATYNCDDGFVISGNERRSCLSGGIWSGSDPKCIRKPIISVTMTTPT